MHNPRILHGEPLHDFTITFPPNPLIFLVIKTPGIREGSVFGPLIFLVIKTTGIREGSVFGPLIFLVIKTTGIRGKGKKF